MTGSSSHSHDKGFSVLEVLLGVSVFAIGLMGVMALHMYSLKGVAFSGNLTEANAIAANQLERLMRADINTLVDGPSPNSPNGLAGLNDTGNAADGLATGVGTNGKYTVCWNIAPNQPANTLRTVRVHVLWSVRGTTQQISISGIRRRF